MADLSLIAEFIELEEATHAAASSLVAPHSSSATAAQAAAYHAIRNEILIATGDPVSHNTLASTATASNSAMDCSDAIAAPAPAGTADDGTPAAANIPVAVKADGNDGSDSSDSDSSDGEPAKNPLHDSNLIPVDADDEEDEEDGGGGAQPAARTKNELSLASLPVPPVGHLVVSSAFETDSIGAILNVQAGSGWDDPSGVASSAGGKGKRSGGSKDASGAAATATITIVVQSHPKARPLDESSVLCLADRRVVGRIEDVFGPVSAPMYLLRVRARPDVPQSEIDDRLKAEGAGKFSAPAFGELSVSAGSSSAALIDGTNNGAAVSSAAVPSGLALLVSDYDDDDDDGDCKVDLGESTTGPPAASISDVPAGVEVQSDVGGGSGANSSLSSSDRIDQVPPSSTSELAPSTVVISASNTAVSDSPSSAQVSAPSASAPAPAETLIRVADLVAGTSIYAVRALSKFVFPEAIRRAFPKGSDASNFYDEEIATGAFLHRPVFCIEFQCCSILCVYMFCDWPALPTTVCARTTNIFPAMPTLPRCVYVCLFARAEEQEYSDDEAEARARATGKAARKRDRAGGSAAAGATIVDGEAAMSGKTGGAGLRRDRGPGHQPAPQGHQSAHYRGLEAQSSSASSGAGWGGPFQGGSVMSSSASDRQQLQQQQPGGGAVDWRNLHAAGLAPPVVGYPQMAYAQQAFAQPPQPMYFSPQQQQQPPPFYPYGPPGSWPAAGWTNQQQQQHMIQQLQLQLQQQQLQWQYAQQYFPQPPQQPQQQQQQMYYPPPPPQGNGGQR